MHHRDRHINSQRRRLKARHRTMWAQGDYAVAAELIPGLGAVLVDAAGVSRGQRVLDVAVGTGNVAIPAAECGALVTASDLTPELLGVGRRLAEDRGVALDWDVADAEALPYGAQGPSTSSCPAWASCSPRIIS